MKKVIIILSILLLAGCGVQDKTSMTINEDKSINIEVLKAADNDFIDQAINEKYESDKTYTDEERWKYIDDTINEGMKDYPNVLYEKYENGEYKGYKFIVKINNIDDVTADDAKFNISDFLYAESSKLFQKNEDTYLSKIYYIGFQVLEEADYDFSFTLTLPNEPISHNADMVSEDKKTLTWDLLKPNDGEIKFEFTFDDNKKEEVEEENNIILIISSIVGIIVLLVIIIVIFKKQKKVEL